MAACDLPVAQPTKAQGLESKRRAPVRAQALLLCSGAWVGRSIGCAAGSPASHLQRRRATPWCAALLLASLIAVVEHWRRAPRRPSSPAGTCSTALAAGALPAPPGCPHQLPRTRADFLSVGRGPSCWALPAAPAPLGCRLPGAHLCLRPPLPSAGARPLVNACSSHGAEGQRVWWHLQAARPHRRRRRAVRPLRRRGGCCLGLDWAWNRCCAAGFTAPCMPSCLPAAPTPLPPPRLATAALSWCDGRSLRRRWTARWRMPWRSTAATRSATQSRRATTHTAWRSS